MEYVILGLVCIVFFLLAISGLAHEKCKEYECHFPEDEDDRANWEKDVDENDHLQGGLV